MDADKLSSDQTPHSALNRALRQACGAGDRLVAEPRGFHPAAQRLTPQVEIHQEGGRNAIVAHQVAHQDIHDVVINLHDYIFKHYSV